MKRLSFLRHSLHGLLPLLALLCGLIALVALSGCGGSAGRKRPSALSANGLSVGATTGRARLMIQWPARSATNGRLIPLAANSITITLAQHNGAMLVQRTLPRPASGDTTVVDLPNLPLGAADVGATAFPNTDGTGVAQASGSGSVIIAADILTPITVVMGTTIDHIEAAPVGPLNVQVGSTLTVTATARDASGAMVLLSPLKATWTSNNGNVASIDAAGFVTADGVGSAVLTFFDSESGKSASVQVTVTAATPTPTPSPTASPAATDFYATQFDSRDIVHYDSNGKPLGTITIPASIAGDLRGAGIGPDGLLYVVGLNYSIMGTGFVVMTVDVNKTVRVKYAYFGTGAYLGGNLPLGKIAFDKNNRVLVGVSGGIVAFPLNGSQNSGTILWSGGDAYDIAVLPSGELLVMGENKLTRMAADGSNARELFGSSLGIVYGRGVAYDAASDTIFITFSGYFNHFDVLEALDGTTYTVKKAVSYPSCDDLFLVGDGRLLVGSEFGVPGIFDKDLNKLGDLGETEQTFVTGGTITGTTP